MVPVGELVWYQWVSWCGTSGWAGVVPVGELVWYQWVGWCGTSQLGGVVFSA